MRNIEIKAKIENPNVFTSAVKQLTDSDYTIIKQEDTFFKVATGRLKLREFQDGTGELIYYQRSDTLGPKLCNYEKTLIDAKACAGIKKVLTASNGCVGQVKKIRKLYMIGQTRVHVDEVQNLGSFMELEVVLTDTQSIEDGEKIAEDLMNKLTVKKEDLIAEAYIDLLLKS